MRPHIPYNRGGRHGRLFALGILCGSLILSTASGQNAETDTENDDIYTLSPFTVSAEEDYGYRKTVAVTATRIGSNILETPINISVVSRELLDDLKVDTSNNAFYYTAGVNTNMDAFTNILSPTRAGASLYVRGFGLNSFVYQDGFRRSTAFAMDGVERVEVVKKPASLFFGRMEPGGLVNFVTKKPDFIESSYVDVTVGNDSYFKGLLDHQNVVQNGDLAYRFVTSLKDADSWYMDSHDDESYFLGSLAWAPSRRFEALLQFEDFNQEHAGGPGGASLTNLRFLKAAGAAPFEGPNTLQFTEVDADNDPATAPIKLYESVNTFTQRLSQEQQKDLRRWDGYWFPREFNFNRNGIGAKEDNYSKSIGLDAVFRPSEASSIRLAYNDTDTETNTFWYIANDNVSQSPAGRLNNMRAMAPAFATGGDPNCFTCYNYGFFMSPRFDPEGSTRPGRAAAVGNSKTVQLDGSYTFSGLGGQHTFVASAELIEVEGRSYGFVTDRDAFVRAGGIPAGVSGFGEDVGLSAESNAILMQKRQQLEDWGLIAEGARIPNDVFSALFVDIMKDPVPNLSDMIKGRSRFARRGTDSQDTSYGLTYQGQLFESKLFILGGLRYNKFETEGIDIDQSDGTETPSGNDESWDEVTPQVGVLYSLSEGVKLYASFSQNFLPQPGNRNPEVRNLETGETFGGNLLAPETGEGFDLGAKFDAQEGKISGSMAYFQVERSDIIISDSSFNQRMQDENLAREAAGLDPIWVDEDGFPITQSNANAQDINSGVQEVEGVEAEFVYTPIPNFQAIIGGSYYFTKEWTKKDPTLVNVNRGGEWGGFNFNDGTDALPDELPKVPDFMAFFWGKYTFTEGPLENFAIGLGGNYQEATLNEIRTSTNLISWGDWWRFDAMLSYLPPQFEDGALRLQLTVNNLLDEEILAGSWGMQPTREWRLSARYKF